MSFDPDPTEKAKDVIFPRNTTKKIYLKIFLNNILVSQADSE